MPPSAVVSSTSFRAPSPVAGLGRARGELAAARASWRAMASERLYQMGLSGGIATWLAVPLFQIATLAVLYGTGSELLDYLIVAWAANMFVVSSLFFVGEILDRERMKGTLVALFLAPCARFSWLSGFISAGLIETSFVAAVIVLFGRFALGVHFDPNLPAVALVAALFLASLWGLGIIFSGIGLIIRKANPLSNLLYNFVILFGGAYYPVSQLPQPLRAFARCLPLGYGMQALADASLKHASLRELAPNLLPLLGFALVLPLAGITAFRYLERMVRVRGDLDLY